MAGPSQLRRGLQTNWNFNNGTYGYLSTRHLEIEAGLGTLGLGVNILTPEFGPRVYLTGILTELELEPDHIRTEQICIGEGCSRCLYGCPADAVNHFGLNKARCLIKAQEFGFAPMIKFFSEYMVADRDAKRALLQSCEAFGLLQAMQRVVGLYGSCPRCHATCPIGHDYRAFLGDAQKVIPEKTGEKVAKGRAMRNARITGQAVAGLNDWNIRWVGPDGYSGTATRKHIEEFKRYQKTVARADANLSDSEGTTGTRAMDTICRRPLTQEIKDKARKLGADLVGIADGAAMEINPPDALDPRRPSDITSHDGKQAIVLAKRLNYGTTRLPGWYDRNKFYNDELSFHTRGNCPRAVIVVGRPGLSHADGAADDNRAVASSGQSRNSEQANSVGEPRRRRGRSRYPWT